MADALRVDTGYSDTHPCLRERLEALGFDRNAGAATQSDLLRTTEQIKQTAADQFLGAGQNSLVARLDDAWTTSISANWKASYDEFQASKARLAELTAQSADRPLSSDETWERITLTATVTGAEASMPLLRDLLSNQPDHALGNYSMGQILTDNNDSDGVPLLQRAMGKEPELMIPCCAALYRFFMRQGNDKQSQRYLNRLEEQTGLLTLARRERQNVTRKDSLTTHNLPAAELTRINEQLARYPSIRIAYLARKAVVHYPEKPFFVMAVSLRTSPFKRNQPALLANRLAKEITFPGETYVVVLGSGSHWLKKQIRRVPGALIYTR